MGPADPDFRVAPSSSTLDNQMTTQDYNNPTSTINSNTVTAELTRESRGGNADPNLFNGQDMHAGTGGSSKMRPRPYQPGAAQRNNMRTIHN